MRAAHAYGDSVKETLLPLFTSMSLSKGIFPFGLSAACVCNATLLLTGMVVYRSLELWSWVDCFYATSGVLTTVGILKVPQRPSARAFTALLHVASMGVSGLYIAEVSEGRRAWGRRATNLNSDTLVHALLTLPLMLLAALVLAQLEGWGLGEALYFTLTCSTGLGMGDVEPVTPAARLLLPPFLFYVMGTTFQCMAAIGTALLGAVQASAQPHKTAGSSQ
jgi:hypothetical protein